MLLLNDRSNSSEKEELLSTEGFFSNKQNHQQKSNAMHEKITNSKSSNNITDFQMKSKEQPDLITGVHVQL